MRFVLALLVVAPLVSCAMDFDPPSLLDEPRILALIPDPIEIDLSDPTADIEILSVVHLPSTATVTSSRWSFCPISTGARGAFTCVLPACQIELDEIAPGLVRVAPATLAAECQERLRSSGIEFEGEVGMPPESFETSFRHRVETSEGAPAEAVARVRAFTRNAPSPARTHPRISQIRLGGMVADSLATELRVVENAELNIELEVEAGTGSTEEDLYVSYYATAGRFFRLRTDRGAGTNTWTAEELGAGDQAAELYFVARDGRGGQAVAGPYHVEILRSAP